MKTILVDGGKTFVIDGKIDEEMHNLLESYENPKIILTNADDEQLVLSGLVNMPYEVFTLKHNPDKVDPKYFNIFLKEHNLDVSDVVCFDHTQEAIDTAESLGIVSYFYDSSNRDLVALKKFLDSNLD